MIKQYVSLDRSANIRTLTAVAVCAFIVGSVMISPSLLGMAVLCPLVVIAVALAMFAAPWTVSVDDSGLTLSSSLWSRKIAIDKIASIERADASDRRATPSSSAGILGYWGNFDSEKYGSYKASFGNAADCFLVTLTDGRKYMIGCNNPDTIVQAIKDRLPQPEPVME